ncbi:MAG: hypothetical protein M3325_18275, partial [Actinomycetota bacterium]|nr:hypothetical protein [Actinomycetota bacterium]
MSVSKDDAPTSLTTPSRPLPAPSPATHAPGRWAVLRSAVLLPEVRWAALALVLFAVGAFMQLAGAPAPLWWGLYLAA